MKKLKRLTAFALTIPFLAAPLTGMADGQKTEKAKPYPLNTCIVSGEMLGGMDKPYVFTHDGQEVKLCCKKCLKKFNANAAKYMKTIAEAKAYPLDTCLVSGEKLGKMDKAYVFTHDGHVVKLCCKKCLKKFKADPAKYMKKLKEAAAKKKESSGQKG